MGIWAGMPSWAGMAVTTATAAAAGAEHQRRHCLQHQLLHKRRGCDGCGSRARRQLLLLRPQQLLVPLRWSHGLPYQFCGVEVGACGALLHAAAFAFACSRWPIHAAAVAVAAAAAILPPFLSSLFARLTSFLQAVLLAAAEPHRWQEDEVEELMQLADDDDSYRMEVLGCNKRNWALIGARLGVDGMIAKARWHAERYKSTSGV